jgi:hypothetical protein
MFKSWRAPAAALVCCVLVTGCASVPMAAPEADSAAKAFATDPAKANVYIYRNESMGGAVTMKVLLDDQPVGATAAQTYIYRQVDPGTHVITSKAENDATLSLDAVAGQNYFVWQEVKMGLLSARSKLQLVDEAKGKAGVKECKLVK